MVFIDTNVFVYNRDSKDPGKRDIARSILKRVWEERCGRISYQVLKEYYNIVTNKLRPGLPVEEAREDVVRLLKWKSVAVNLQLLTIAWKTEDTYSFSSWDALIVAAAQI